MATMDSYTPFVTGDLEIIKHLYMSFVIYACEIIYTLA